jgi:hypothetical protein
MKHIFLALFAVFCYSYAETYEPDEGYSRAERAAMTKLVEREIAKPKHKGMTGAQARQVIELFGEGR